MSGIEVPPFEEVWSGLDAERTRQVGEQVDTARTDVPWYFKVMLAGGLAVFVLALLLGQVLIALGAAVVFAIPAFVVVRRLANASRTVSTDVTAPVFEAIAAGLTLPHAAHDGAALRAEYEPEGSVPQPRLRSAGFIVDTSVLQEDVVTGTLGETDFVLADLKWQQMRPPAPEADPEKEARDRRRMERLQDSARRGTLDSRRRQDELSRLEARFERGGDLSALVPKSLRTSVQGWAEQVTTDTAMLGPSSVFFSADFHKDFTSTVYLLPRKDHQAFRGLSEDTARERGITPLRLEDVRITRQYEGWASDQVEARYLITPELMDTLDRLRERFGTEHMAVSFTGGRMNIGAALDTNRFGFDLARQHERTIEDMGRDIYEDLVLFLGLVEDFRLNTRIWSKD
ncbi:hypothetical protein FM125_08030 [Micrococcus lylae]|uniref:DUF3137 domain-containing protein n=1 Tax=Micrococcus lylae TaxID=1273 RepID=A0A1R4JEZ9_9MICC|nr:DUF3137 domain-containing protein [Micrococcus lylae]SJN30333.1 hypothetical protein FM125_08030 [Micrococcus lylae]